MILTTATKKISKIRNRIRIIQGGTSAGKTYSILYCLIYLAIKQKLEISIVAESIPHLRRGALKDFKKLMLMMGVYKDSSLNHSTLTYTFLNGSTIEFFSADQPDKLRGARRDILFINECNNIDYEAFTQLEVRTNKFIYLDFNPTHEFWVQTEILANPLFDAGFIKINYKDNEALNEQIIKSIESRRNNEYWWTVYGEGETGVLEGSIFKKYSFGDFDENLSFGFGLDFGFYPDPTACVKVAINETTKKIYLKEICYATELTEGNIIEMLQLNTNKNDSIIADCADKRLIDAIREQGFNISPAEKGAGSIREGLLFMQDYELVVHPGGNNIWKEMQNYSWNDKRAGIPIDKHNHCVDAIRYALEKLRSPDFYFG